MVSLFAMMMIIAIMAVTMVDGEASCQVLRILKTMAMSLKVLRMEMRIQPVNSKPYFPTPFSSQETLGRHKLASHVTVG